jgi:hypothetical protein
MGDDGCQAGLGGSHPRELRHHHHLLSSGSVWHGPFPAAVAAGFFSAS